MNYLIPIHLFLAKPRETSRFINTLTRNNIPVVRVFEHETGIEGFIIASKSMWIIEAAKLFNIRIKKAELREVSGLLLKYPRIGIYSGRGTYIEGRVHADTLRQLGFYRQTWLSDLDIYKPWFFDILVVPGGWGLRGPDFIPFGGEGGERLRKFIEDGGGYLGTCAGSIYLGKKILAKDLTPGLTLGLLDADVVACFRGRGLVKIRVVEDPPILLSGFPKVFPVYHSGGFVLKPYENGNTKTIAVFDELYKYEEYPWTTRERLEKLLGSAANIVVGELGKGKIVALSSHPEYQSHLRTGIVKFRTEGREYTLNEDEILMGFALEAISIFFLSSTRVKDYTLKEVSELVGKTEKRVDKEFTGKCFEKVLESCREVEELASYCRENRDIIPLTFLDDYYLTFTSKEPPDWVKERYIGFPNVEEYIKRIFEYTKTGYYVELVSEDELTSIGNLGKSYTRYLKSLAKGLVEAHKLLKEAGDPVGFSKKVKEYRKCIRGGLIGKAIELKKDIIVSAWENPLKWEETLNEYKRTFEREMFSVLVEVNRKVLGTIARILYSIEEARDDHYLIKATKSSTGI